MVQGGRRASATTSTRTRRSASSASRARARRVTSLAILGLLPKTAHDHRRDPVPGPRPARGCSEQELQTLRGRQHRHGVPGRARRAEPGVHGRRPDRRGDQGARRPRKTASSTPSGSSSCSTWSASRNPKQRADQYPHEFSGGMRQRAMIAMSIANDPDVLIADEPTTALDVTIQAQVLEVFERIQDRTELGDPAHHPRPRRRRRRRRPGAGDVRRPPGRDRHRRRDLLRAAATPTRRACSPRCPASTATGRRAGCYRIKGQPPSLIRLPPGCAVPPALPAAPRCPACATPIDPSWRDGRRPTTGRRATSPTSSTGDRPPSDLAAIDRRVREDDARVEPADRRPSDRGAAPSSRRPPGRPAARGPRPGQALPDPRRACSAARSAQVHAVVRRQLRRRRRARRSALVGESGCGKSTTGRLRAAPDRADRRARCSSTAATSPTLERREHAARCAGGCRSSSRIRTRRSTRA